MAIDDDKDTLPIKQLWEEYWNQRKLEVISEIFSPDFVFHAGEDQFHGIDVAINVIASTLVSDNA